LSIAIDKRKQLMGDRILGLNYDPQTYAFLIREVGRLYRGEKQKIVTAALDLFEGSKVQLLLLESVRIFRVNLEAYRAILDAYRIGEAGFAPNGKLYREIKDRMFTQPDLVRFHDRRSSKGWPDSTEGISEWLDHHQSILEYWQQGSKTSTPFPKDQLRAHEQEDFSYPMSAANVHIAFRTVVRCIGNEGAVNQVNSDDNYVFHDHEDTTLEVIHHMLKSGRKSGRNFKKNEDSDWKGKHCKENHLITDCLIYNALNNRDKLDHIMKVGRCFNCYRKGHISSGCISELKCTVQKCGAKHNSALHEAWTASSKALLLLTKTVSPITLLTFPVMSSAPSGCKGGDDVQVTKSWALPSDLKDPPTHEQHERQNKLEERGQLKQINFKVSGKDK
jgi:hypothetical protein